MRNLLLVLASATALTCAAFGQVSDPFAGIDARLAARADDVLEAARAVPSDAEATPLAPPSAPAPITRAQARVAALRPVIDPVLRRYGVPVELASVVLVESGGVPAALSPKGALGLWQLMPATARRYGLVVNDRVDERTDVFKATEAAARYLGDLYAQFGDWKLALAAYNAGENAVARAIDFAGSNDFNRLVERRALPAETRAYVPAVLQTAGLDEAGARTARGRITVATSQFTR